MKPTIEELSTPYDLAQRAAQLIVSLSENTLITGGSFSIALSGGSTPKRLYELLADSSEPFRMRLQWERLQFFWTDERHVGPDHPDSNYRMAYGAMLSRVPVPGDNIHRILGELDDAEAAARDYENQLLNFFSSGDDAWPQFDLVLLGLGTDGHTASVFPGSPVLTERHRLVAAPWVEKLNTYRFTMTLPVLNNAKTVVFLVSGVEKAGILSEVLEGPGGKFPAQSISPTHGQLIWLVDRQAAGKITRH